MDSPLIEIEIPDDFEKITHLSGDDLSKQFKLALAIMLFQQNKISIGKAAELAGMLKWDFENELANNGIKSYDLSPEQLKEDVAKLTMVS